MITGINTLLFTSEPEKTREVLAEVLEFPVEDLGDGWLRFEVPSTTLAVHPLEEDHDPFHEVSFTCDHIEETVADLEDIDGVSVANSIEDQGFGRVTSIELPGSVSVSLIEPR